MKICEPVWCSSEEPNELMKERNGEYDDRLALRNISVENHAEVASPVYATDG